MNIIELSPSRLIQRLEKPMKLNPFSFGGGLQHGGIKKKTVKMLSKIFSFSYMGAAEFEWGAVPETLSLIFKNKQNYKFFTHNVKWRVGSGKEAKKGKSKVYILCPTEWIEEVYNRIDAYCLGKEWTKKYETKEYVGLNITLDNYIDVNIQRAIGWLEISNGYFFFTDKEMCLKVCDLFNIEY